MKVKELKKILDKLPKDKEIRFCWQWEWDFFKIENIGYGKDDDIVYIYINKDYGKLR